MNKIYAIIPARGGSKGIINKNLSKLAGRSLVEIGVTTCMNAKMVSRVLVSTDDGDIAKEAKRLGAEVIMRPDSISGDLSSSEEAILHALSKITDKPDTVLFYQITNPFTRAEDIDDACNYFFKSQADSLFTATMFTHFLWHRKDGKVLPINHNYTERAMRQKIDNCFRENGAFYLMNTAGFVKNKHRFFGNIEVFKMRDISAYEIDEPHDLKIASILYNES